MSPPFESSWPAPAKLNLFLHIVGRRADGYHRLQTLFQFLDYGDRLTFRVRADGRIVRRGGPADVAVEADLCVRAARALQRATGTLHGVEIALDKRLPLGGGLGGGSSDAATTLVALNRLWATGLEDAELQRLGLELGADVPIFVHGHAAWAEGVGEELIDVDPPTPWYVVVAPSVHVATGEVFGAPELTRDCAPITISDFLSGRCGNVCEPVVRSRYPVVAEALDWLGRYGPARMTGTGACVFAAFEDEVGARRVAEQLPGQWTGFVARGVNRSPLLDRLERQDPAP